jgi:hypothetical protein
VATMVCTSCPFLKTCREVVPAKSILVPFAALSLMSVSLISHPCLFAVLRLMRERVAPVSAWTLTLKIGFATGLRCNNSGGVGLHALKFVALNNLCDCVDRWVAYVPSIKLCSDLHTFVTLLLLLLLVPLLLLLSGAFEFLELHERCAISLRSYCRSNLSRGVQPLSVVTDDCAVALLLALCAGVCLCWAVLPLLVGGVFAAAVARPLRPACVCVRQQLP